MVSVIVVSYNHSQFINTCLDSIKNQSFKEISLIIIDDCSSDDSQKIIQKWADENPQMTITTRLNEKNIGLCNNLNWALQQSNSDYVKIIAADDYLHHSYLEKAIQRMQTLPNEYKIVYTKAKFVDENNKILTEKGYYEMDNMPSGDVEKKLFEENFICAPSVFLRRNIYDITGYYDPKIIIEDYEHWLNASTKGVKFSFINETLTYYRYHENNTTKTKRDRIHNETMLLRMKYDTTGKHSIAINKVLSYLYQKYKKNLPKEILTQYSSYAGKSKGLFWLIKRNVPITLIKVYLKLFN